MNKENVQTLRTIR